MRRAFFEATVARTHTLLFLARWVASSSVGSRVALRLPGLDFSCGAQRLGKAATLVSSRWSSARRHRLDTSLEQRVERPSHDRTTERHWQRLEPQSRRRYPAVLCDYHQSLCLVEVGGHTCRTPPWACSVSSQSDASRKRVWQVLAELAVSSWAWRADTHALDLRRSWAHWVMVVHQQRAP